MHIILIGNICTGKTTLAEQLHAHFDFPIFSIDDYRRKYNQNADFNGEFAAWTNLRADISKAENSIFESSGVSMWYEEILKNLSGEKIVVKLKADTETILLRYENRKTCVPMPYKTKNITETILKMEEKLKNAPFSIEFDTTHGLKNAIEKIAEYLR